MFFTVASVLFVEVVAFVVKNSILGENNCVGCTQGVQSDCDIEPDDSVNMSVWIALDRRQASPQSFCLNDIAAKNISDMLVTLDTSHPERSPLNDVADANISDMLVTLDTSHFKRSPLNDVPMNILDIVVTLDTSHFERSPLKSV